MKVVKGNAGALTNFEVLDFLNSRGASKDTTRVIAPIARSEYKVYDYLMETAACTQTRECVTSFTEKCKYFKLAKAEILNIVNLRPSSIVELSPIIDEREINTDGILKREIDTDGILELVNDLLPPLPTTGSHKENEEETENGENHKENDEEETENGESHKENDEEETENGQSHKENYEEETENGEQS